MYGKIDTVRNFSNFTHRYQKLPCTHRKIRNNHFARIENIKANFEGSFIGKAHIFLILTAPLAVWTKVPSSIQYIEEGSNATIAWDYDLNGEVIQFAKWGKLKSDNGWDKSFIMRSFNAAKAQVVASFADKINWIANATMVIINVTVQDSGNYGCSIDLLSGRNIISSMQLNVFRKQFHDVIIL